MLYVGYVASLLYLFIRVSRCTDYFGYVLAHMRVPFAVLGLAILAALVTGRIFNAMLSKLGVKILGLTFVYLLTSAFSIWPGGSVHQLREHWPPNLMVFLVLASFLTSLKGLRAAVLALGVGSGMAAGYGLLLGTTLEGRAAAGNMSYGNPNEFALMLSMGFPAIVLVIADKTRPWWLRAGMIPMLGVSVLSFVGTGSRGGMLGFAVMAMFVMAHMSWAARVQVGVVALLLGIAAVAAAPQATLERFSTLMEVQESGPEQVSSGSFEGEQEGGGGDLTVTAAASARSRLHLMEQAVRITAEHPLMGVGFGMFMVAENTLAQSQGFHRGSWKGTHNMYLQVSSENGIPALALFLSIIVTTWKTLRRHRKLGPRATPSEIEIRNISFAFSASMVTFLVTAAFLTVAYDYFVMMYAAIAVGMDNVALLEKQRLERKAREEAGDAEDEPRSLPSWTPEPVGAATYSQGLS